MFALEKTYIKKKKNFGVCTRRRERNLTTVGDRRRSRFASDEAASPVFDKLSSPLFTSDDVENLASEVGINFQVSEFWLSLVNSIVG